MRNEIGLTDDEIEARFEDLSYGLTVNDLTFTRDTIENFRDARRQYNEPGRIITDEDDCLVVERCQAVRGQTRSTLIVIDFGSVRACKAY